jgi:hypothetical protein
MLFASTWKSNTRQSRSGTEPRVGRPGNVGGTPKGHGAVATATCIATNLSKEQELQLREAFGQQSTIGGDFHDHRRTRAATGAR